MLKEIVRDSLILFLLVYSMLDIFTRLTKFISDHIFKKRNAEGYHVLYLKSGTNTVEAAVRDELLHSERPRYGIILVDMDLSDEEHLIAEKFCKEHTCLTLLRREEYLHFVEQQMTTAKIQG